MIGPSCNPVCGANAHCEYGLSNRCVCNKGTIGNPYEYCEHIEKKTCDASSCGSNAECKESYTGIECICSHGYSGNPYISCEDINECNNNICGNNAVCINTAGAYDCRCKEGFGGNPFILCSEVRGGVCRDADNCVCDEKLLCPSGFSCENNECHNLCEHKQCGPKAVCDDGQCICPPGYVGNPNDLFVGCKIQGQCNSDLECYDTQICFQLSKGVRKCVDACSKIQCGPNALCLAENHRSSCICGDGYKGNPEDLTVGCQLEERINQKQCEKDADCKFGTICSIDSKGLQKCISPCETVACGLHEMCQLDISGHPTCACRDDYIWNPVSSLCEKPSVPDCKSDADCQPVASCQPDALGVFKCVPVCSHFTCPNNAACVAESHKGQCQCLAGFTGNPNDRNGCGPISQNQCTSDTQCSEQETCRKHAEQNILMCMPACDSLKCGPSAICVVHNHVPQCQCPEGSYIGDPNDISSGCKSVPCVYNIDCPPSQLCNRMTHTCMNVCDEESCGANAVCRGEDHKATCQCPNGFIPNPLPEVECIPVDVCNPNPCHSSALCESSSNGHTCKCPPGLIGDPFTTGCRPEGKCPSGDVDCPPQSICQSGKCVNPCKDINCGSNSVCAVESRKAVCTCLAKYVPSPNQDGCIRSLETCSNDADCDGAVCFNGQCRSVCRNNKDCSSGERCLQNMCVVPCSDHSQCSTDMACIEGMCLLGCRSNKNCPSKQACINNKCQDPCNQKGSCGPNAICNCENHKTVCKCPSGFEGNPTPQQGCIRVPTMCQKTSERAAAHLCIKNHCTFPCEDNGNCAVGERCANNACVKVCYGDSNCLPGEICIDSVCQPGCTVDTDCRLSQVCEKGQCKCANGFIRSSQGCVDINECEKNPCHRTALCKNQPGSYTCVCPDGQVGDPYVKPGCRTGAQCARSRDCADNLVCRQGKCQDPCEDQKCGTQAICEVTKHKQTCVCPPGHLGNPYDKNLGCFKVECLADSDCTANRFCDSHSNKCFSKLLHC